MEEKDYVPDGHVKIELAWISKSRAATEVPA